MVKSILTSMLILVFAGGVASAAPAEIPRTGQTESYVPGDDGDMEKGVAWPDPRFEVSGDCVTDNLTGLMWVRMAESSSMTWTEALDYANSTSPCNYTDWRLPNLNELESLIHAGKSDSSTWLNSQGFKAVDVVSYWTSTTYAGSADPACDGNACAWYVDMQNGYLGFTMKGDPDFTIYAWPVRAGQ